jgi:hypothetical protein
MTGSFASGGLPHDQLSDGGIADGIDNPHKPEPDKPEIEELWAAAALIGEAIGRLKQTDEPIPPELDGQQPLPKTSDSNSEQPEVFHRDQDDRTVMHETDLGDLFVNDGNDAVNPATLAEPTALSSPESTNALPLDFGSALDTDLDAVRGLTAEGADRSHHDAELAPTSDNNAEKGKQADNTLPSGAQTDAPGSYLGHRGQSDIREQSQERAPAQPATVIGEPSQNTAATSSQAVARKSASTPVTHRLHLSGDKQAEGRVRSILGRDPRVLVSPAPQVRVGMGELVVSYTLVPGLPAGECSLLDQQLRDTVT